MRTKILIIAALIGVMLIIGTASAGKPEIKGVSKHSQDATGDIPITVSATDDHSVKSVKANDHELTHKDGDIWEGKIRPDEEIKDVTIEAHDDKETSEKQIYGHGGCPSRDSYNSHPYTYAYAHVDLLQDPDEKNKTNFSLHTEDNHRPGTGVIGICVYPEPGFDPSKGALLKLIYDPNLWEIKHNAGWDYFGFGRHGGLNLIPLDGVRDIVIGSADYKQNTKSEKILIHILDSEECTKDTDEQKKDMDRDSPQNTCWRRPEKLNTIPEFPIIALPVVSALVLMFIFQRMKKEE
ncbi:MAG: PEF-CTERM sorting domain-containing protein [Candidatus Methanoperedens sp.]|nr:PEF-CTERM sorting domain-containing protein [Candidatus Methanoperedens sp.]